MLPLPPVGCTCKMVEYFNIMYEAQNADAPPQSRLSRGSDPNRFGGLLTTSRSKKRLSQGRQNQGDSQGTLEAIQAAQKLYEVDWHEQYARELLHNVWGFHPVIKKSTIRKAGRGLFVEGIVPEGAIVAIQPVSIFHTEGSQ